MVQERAAQKKDKSIARVRGCLDQSLLIAGRRVSSRARGGLRRVHVLARSRGREGTCEVTLEQGTAVPALDVRGFGEAVFGRFTCRLSSSPLAIFAFRCGSDKEQHDWKERKTCVLEHAGRGGLRLLDRECRLMQAHVGVLLFEWCSKG